MPKVTPPRSIYIMAFAQCDELDVIGPGAVFQTANEFLNDSDRKPRGTAVDLRIVAVDGAGAVTLEGPSGPQSVVTGVHGFTIGVQAWDGKVLPDLLIVAGGSMDQGAGIMKQMNNAAFTGPIARQFSDGGKIASVCTGAFGLVGANIAQGHRMTTHPGTVNRLRQSGVIVLNPDWTARVVDEDGIVSCGGVTAGIDEALYFVETCWPDDPQLVSDVRSYVDFPYHATIRASRA